MRKWFYLFLVLFSLLTMTACTNNTMTYTITFETNGGTAIESVILNGTNTINLPEDPSKEGYIFDGWYWDNETFLQPLIELTLNSEALSGNIILYAKWVQEDDELTKQLKNIYLLATSSNTFQGTYEEWLETVKGPQGIPGKDGKEVTFQVSDGFLKWQYVGDTTWTNLIELANLKGVAGQDGIDGKEVTFQVSDGFLKWQYVGETTWTNLIELANLKGDAGVDGQDGLNGLSAYEIYLELYPEYSKSLNEWILDLVNGNLALKEEIIITFNSNQGLFNEQEIFEKKVTQGTYMSEIPIPTREGYQFTGWSTGFTVNDGKLTTLTLIQENLYLYANWEKVSYKIIFYDRNKNIYSQQNYYFNDEIIDLTSIAEEGYQFLGWYVDELLQNPLVFSKMPSSNLSLYSKWKTNDYEIQFEVNGGTLLSNKTVTYNEYVELDVYTQNLGYQFMGWYVDESLTNEFQLEQMPNSNLKLYAKWEEIKLFDRVYPAGQYTIAITEDQHVVAWGRNDYGQLGDQTFINKNRPVDITQLFNFDDNETILSVDISSSTSVLLTSNHRVFVWGFNHEGQIYPSVDWKINVPTDITSNFNLEADEYIVHAEINDNQGIYLTNQGRVFATGNKEMYEILYGTTYNNMPYDITSFMDLINEKIIKISAGRYHVALLTNLGKVYGFGDNSSGELGDDTYNDRLQPTLMNLTTIEGKVIDIFSGAGNTIMKTDINNFYTTGKNFSLPDYPTNRLPILSNSLNSNEIVTNHLSNGAGHVIFLSNDQRIFAYGTNTFGQIGNGETGHVVLYEINLVLDEGVTINHIYAGHGNTSIVLSNGLLYIWGVNIYGALGNGNDFTVKIPTVFKSISE